MLLDFFPASAGRRGSVFTPGERFHGELVFYPSQQPLRALLRHGAMPTRTDAWSRNGPLRMTRSRDALTRPLLAEPWAIDIPLLLPQGGSRATRQDMRGGDLADGTAKLPVAGNAEGLLCGTDLHAHSRDLVGQPAHDPGRPDPLGTDRQLMTDAAKAETIYDAMGAMLTRWTMGSAAAPAASFWRAELGDDPVEAELRLLRFRVSSSAPR